MNPVTLSQVMRSVVFDVRTQLPPKEEYVVYFQVAVNGFAKQYYYFEQLPDQASCNNQCSPLATFEEIPNPPPQDPSQDPLVPPPPLTLEYPEDGMKVVIGPG